MKNWYLGDGASEVCSKFVALCCHLCQGKLSVVVQEKLGSMLDKSKRVESMVQQLGTALAVNNASLAIAQKAAPLAVTDLATAMVKEFTSLVGVMGRHYALREGQSLDVSLIKIGHDVPSMICRKP